MAIKEILEEKEVRKENQTIETSSFAINARNQVM
jgi:hypothetical protein